MNLSRLVRFHRKPCIKPFRPPAFERIDLRIATVQECACHTGTGGFFVSGTVDNECLVFRILVHPVEDF